MSRAEPTAPIRPPQTATASASRSSESAVRTVPLVRTRSGLSAAMLMISPSCGRRRESCPRRRGGARAVVGRGYRIWLLRGGSETLQLAALAFTAEILFVAAVEATLREVGDSS